MFFVLSSNINCIFELIFLTMELDRNKIIEYFEDFNPDRKKSILEHEYFSPYFSMIYELNKKCNFNCFYCGLVNNDIEDSFDADRIAEAFNLSGRQWLIGFTGGEPFLFPDFIKLLSRLSENNYFEINTNLSSHAVYEMPTIKNPEKIICIYAAYHVLERERLDLVDDFIEKVNFLQNNNIHVIVNYLAHPVLFNRIEKDLAFLLAAGVKNVSPKKFIGTYNNKFYPSSYTIEDIDFLKSLKNCFELDLIDFNQNTKGRKCLSGKRYFFMNYLGDCYRCSSVLKFQGNFFNNKIKYNFLTKRCPSNNCGCVFEGLFLSKK